MDLTPSPWDFAVPLGHSPPPARVFGQIFPSTPCWALVFGHLCRYDSGHPYTIRRTMHLNSVVGGVSDADSARSNWRELCRRRLRRRFRAATKHLVVRDKRSRSETPPTGFAPKRGCRRRLRRRFRAATKHLVVRDKRSRSETPPTDDLRPIRRRANARSTSSLRRCCVPARSSLRQEMLRKNRNLPCATAHTRNLAPSR